MAAISPRVAEDLFWLGRYAERAEDVVAAASRVADNRWHDVHPGADPARAGSALDVLLERPGRASPGRPGPRLDDADRRPASSPDRRPGASGTWPTTSAGCASWPAPVRDQLSTDTWADPGRPGSRAALAVRPGPHGRRGAAATAPLPDGSRVREALLAFAGLAAESMVRDAGLAVHGRRPPSRAGPADGPRCCSARWCSGAPSGVEALVEESALIAAESIITHRRRYPAQVRRGHRCSSCC